MTIIKVVALILLGVSNQILVITFASSWWQVITNGIIVTSILYKLAWDNIVKLQQPINNKCNHVPKRHVSVDKPFTYEPICYHCGIELQSVWSEKV